MAWSIQKQSSQPTSISKTLMTINSNAENIRPISPKPRNSLPTDAQPPLDFQWPPVPVSIHTSQLHLTMMNEDPKDLHTARLIINELRGKVRYQTEHIMKWRKAYGIQVQQHYRYQKEKTDQMNILTSQLLLLESRLKRKQKQIANLLIHREMTIQRQQKIIDALSARLLEHGLEPVENTYTMDTFDSLNDSDSAVVLEDMDSDTNTTLSSRRRSSGGGGNTGDGITIVRSISDAIETNLNKYGGVRRNNCFLRRPDILETVYSVEEDPEPTPDVAEKRDKFKNRSEKAVSSSSTEGQIDNSCSQINVDKTKETQNNCLSPMPRQPSSPIKDGHTACSMRVPQLRRGPSTFSARSLDDNVQEIEAPVKSQVTNYNRVMLNHRSVTKPKDVKYKRINKAKSKSLEELRGKLKNIVERNGVEPGCGYVPKVMHQTAQSYA